MRSHGAEQGSSDSDKKIIDANDLLEALLGDGLSTPKVRRQSPEFESPPNGGSNGRQKKAAVSAGLATPTLPSSNHARPFDEPRLTSDRRTSSKAYLIPDGGCRRKRDRRSSRSSMRSGVWWMMRSYNDNDSR